MPSCKIKYKTKDIFTNYSTRNQSSKKQLEKAIEERPEEMTNPSHFGDWEINSFLGRKTVGDPSILISVD